MNSQDLIIMRRSYGTSRPPESDGLQEQALRTRSLATGVGSSNISMWIWALPAPTSPGVLAQLPGAQGTATPYPRDLAIPSVTPRPGRSHRISPTTSCVLVRITDLTN